MKENIQHQFKKLLEGYFPGREIEQLSRIYYEDKEWEDGTSMDDLIRIVSDDLNELIRGKPIQYVTGKSYFYDRIFHVDKNVLIPRPETEELVALILEKHKGKPGLSILDVGTGSGCIPIVLADQLEDPEVYSVDISHKAIEIAKVNAVKYDVKINFTAIDFLNEAHWEGFPPFNIIVSNPPYIRSAERSIMSDSVLAYEPVSALIPESDDPLIFYKKIAAFGRLHLKNKGKIYVEINEFLGPETQNVFIEAGYITSLLCDMQGKNRIIEALINF